MSLEEAGWRWRNVSLEEAGEVAEKGLGEGGGGGKESGGEGCSPEKETRERGPQDECHGQSTTFRMLSGCEVTTSCTPGHTGI